MAEFNLGLIRAARLQLRAGGPIYNVSEKLSCQWDFAVYIKTIYENQIGNFWRQQKERKDWKKRERCLAYALFGFACLCESIAVHVIIVAILSLRHIELENISLS